MKNVCIVIPAYNEEKHIGFLLKSIKQIYDIPVILVDDGSTDKTIEIAERFTYKIIKHKNNKGKGKSLIDGVYFAKNKFEYAILMDADGQHLPEDIGKFLKVINKYDIIIGKRNMSLSNMPILRYFTNRMTTLLVSLITGKKVYDTQSGFRAVKVNSFMKIPIKTFRFQMESEILIKAGRMGLKIGVVEVETIYGEEVSKINPILDTFRFIKMIMEAIWL